MGETKLTTLINNRYQLVDTLGKGGMGVVYRAYDRLEQQHVALKQVLLPTSALDFGTKPGTNDTDKLRIGLAREFSILATLRHPHILSVLDYGFDEAGHPYYAMTLLEGATNFRDYALAQSESTRYDLILQILQALHYLHRRGVLHRDLKPDNVLVTRDGQVKVMDFGLAKEDKGLPDSQQSGKLFGTLRYMAPELMNGESASTEYDLYALGVMVYEVLFEKYPYVYETIAHLMLQILTQPVDCSALPPKLALWLNRLLAKDPTERPSSAYDAMLGLHAALERDVPPENKTIRESFLQASAFVGRDAELKQLTDALEKIKTENAFFLIGGESGVGKSRLLDELRIRALVVGAQVMRGQAVEGGGLPFQLWRNIVRRMLLMVGVSDLQASVLKDIVPDLSELLGRDIPDAPELAGKAYQERMILNIIDLFRKLPQPVVLVLEDLQWTGESLAVLERMLKVREQLPQLMIIASYRDDETPNLPEKLRGMRHIKLERLTPEAVSELSSAMLGEGGKNEAVVKLLHSQSEGNVFFLVETVRALAEASGDLQRIGQGELPEGVFTGGMQAITRRHLSKVDNRYNEIQTLAAIIGREIDTKLLEHANDEATVQAWLDNASEYGVVSIQENRWRFAHDKLRDAILADVPDEILPQIHRTAAETIETIYPDDAGYNEALLMHWHAVGDTDKTYVYLLPVAKYMIEISGTYTIAEAHLHQMLDRLPKDDGRCIALWNWLADSTERQSSYSASQGYALQAQELATSLDDRAGLATSLKNLGAIALNQGEYARATERYQQSMAIFQQLGDQAGIATSLNNLGLIAESQGDYARATDLYQQSLAIHQPLGDRRGIAVSLNSLGGIAMDQGDYARATDLFQQSLAIRQQLGDRGGIASSLNNLGNIAMDQGDYARATDLHQQSLAIRQQLGDQRGGAVSLNNLGQVARSQGDYARATDLFQQSLAIRQPLGDQLGIAICLINLGNAAISQGESARATDFFLQSLVITFDIQAITLILANIVGFAEHFLVQGHIERAAHFIGMVQNHPAEDSQGLNYLEKVVMPQLETALASEDLQAALDHGKTLDLDTVVAELLAEFGGGDRVISVSDNEASTTTVQPVAENAAPSLDSVIAYALAKLNDASVDETMLSTEAARQKLSAVQIVELERKLAAKHDGSDADATVNLQDIIDDLVAMLRDMPDTE